MSFFLYALFQLGTFLCSNAKMQRFDGPTFPGVGKATLQEVQLPEVRIATSLNGPTSFAGGKGAVREIAMPNADLHQIGTELRKVEVKRGLPEGDQKDAVEEGLVLADDNTVECETGKDPEALVGKKFLKIALPAKEKEGSDAEGPKATLTTTTMTSSTQLTTVEPKDRKEERTDSVGKEENRNPSGKPESETTKAKGAPALIPKGPPMPPPKSLPSGPPGATQNTQSPQQPPKPQVPLALPMPGGVGGRVRNYKLIYFDARGICEPIRLIFHYAKIPFDDVRISRKQWLALKDSTVYGKVPILEVDGKPLTYCHTIARYLARSFGIAGRDSWEEAKVDEVSDFHADVAMDLQPYMYVIAGFHQGDKNALRTSVFLPNVEKHFPVYVNLLKQSGSGFFVPSGITWVDFVVAEYMTTVRHFEPQILDKYPAINKFIRKVQTQPQIFDYITNREHQPVML